MIHYDFKIESLDKQIQRVSVTGDGKALTFRQVLAGWSAGADLADVFTRLIASSPFTAVLWEMPPLTDAYLDDPYECVLVDSPTLGRMAANPAPFSDYFTNCEKIAVFSNLGADAVLLAPVPEPEEAQYTHLGLFCRTASTALCRRFWQRLGEVGLSQICEAPVWISTSGLGVGWLHARLDTHPKYYSYSPYRSWPRK